MKKNEPSSTASMSTTSSVNDKWSNSFQKAQRYLGLFVVLSLAYLLFSPRSSVGILGYGGGNPRPYILNEHYYHETNLSDIVISFNHAHAWDIRVAGDYIRACEKAKISVFYDKGKLTEEELLKNIERLPVAEKKKATQLILDGCTPPNLASAANSKRAAQIEPAYWDLNKRLYELREKAREDQGLERDHQPRPTPEMLSISDRLEEIRKPLVKASAEWLVLINGIVHIVFVVLIGFGLRFRGLVGRILLAPFAWVLSGVKKAHEKV